MDTPNKKSDEIDLGVIYHAIKRFFSGLGNYLSTIFFIAKKRWGLVLVFSLLGIGIGIGLFFIMKPVYSSTITLSSGTLNNDFCSDLIENLGLIVEDNSPELLAKKLKIDLSSAKQIEKIEFNNYNEKLSKKYEDKDTVVLGLPFKIKVYAYNNTIFDTLQKVLVNYLEENEYALKRKEIKRQNIKQMREKLSNVIYELDSLKNVVSTNLLPRGNASGFVFGQPLDPVNVYREGISLFQQDLDLNTESILIDNIQVVSGFSARNKPDSPKIWKTTAAGGGVGLLFGLLLAFALERRKKISNIENVL